MAAEHGNAGLDLFHFGVVVDDIHEAIATYQKTFGMSFTQVKDISLEVIVDGELRQVRMYAVYTKDGPPYVELIQEQSGGVWGRHNLNLNHMGFWTSDVEAAVAHFQKQGCASRVVATGSPPRMAYVEGPGIVWIELVGPAIRPFLEEWLTTSYAGPDGEYTAGMFAFSRESRP